MKLILMGTGGTGKTPFAIQYVENRWEPKYIPTIEESYRVERKIDDEVWILEILDTAGTEQFTSMRDLYMKAGQGFILMYSIISDSTFHDLKIVRNQILKVKEKDTVAMVLCGNKCDLEERREVETAEGQQLATLWGCPFFETSARYKINVDEAFFALCREVIPDLPPLKKLNGGCMLL
eukprot:TRINITY_DN5750_c0_g1_i11.p1 TRINITY_DN5750_c0_g1~~TRINITY_DN5750_c0_g1_i11.p1  ORF type:complete len:198 (-),score=47.11 TRINITY_DN5750_c0_g1_i11:63-599(-)